MGKSQSKGSNPAKTPTDKEKGDGAAPTNKNDFLGEVPEITENICGLLDKDYLVTSTIDDPIQRDFAFYHIYNFGQPELCTYAIIARPEVKKWRSFSSMNSYLEVLKVVQNKSRHFPTLLKHGSVANLIFGTDGEQQEERDPEWKSRPVLLVKTRKPITFLSSFVNFSPTGVVSLHVALHAALGMCRALAALHRAGFISRFVTPYSFGVETPYTLDGISKNMIIVDLCLAKEWPSKPISRVKFTGSPKYSSIKVHQEQQGPSDDLLSMIYIIAEMMSGKLPWRSVKDLNKICKMKSNFHKSSEFKRMPHEIRLFYCDLMETGSLQSVEHATIINAIKKSIERIARKSDAVLSKWLCMPLDD